MTSFRMGFGFGFGFGVDDHVLSYLGLSYDTLTYRVSNVTIIPRYLISDYDSYMNISYSDLRFANGGGQVGREAVAVPLYFPSSFL